MKNILKTLIISSAVFSMTACGQSPQMVQPLTLAPQIQAQHVSTPQLLVRFKPDAHRMTIQMFQERYGLHIVDYIPQLNVYVMKTTILRGAPLSQTIAAMQNDPVVSHVEENQSVQVTPVYDDMRISPIINR